MKERKSEIRERMQKAGRAHAAEQAKKALDRAKDTAGNLIDDGQITPEEYASDQVKYSAEELGDYAVHTAGHDAKTVVQKGRDSVRRHAEKANNNAGRGSSPALSSERINTNHGPIPSGSVDGRAVPGTEGNGHLSNNRFASGRARMERSGRVRVVNSPGSGEIGRSVRRSNAPGRQAERSVNLSRKAAMQSAQKAKQVEHIAKKQAEKSAKAAKRTVETAKRAARAAAAAVKSTFSLLTAGGSSAMMMLIPILVIGLLAGSVFAIFLPDDEERMSTRTVIQSIDQEYNERLEKIKGDYSYDRLELTGSKAPWREVLAVYAVLVNTDPENPRDVAIMDEDRAEVLRDVFWDMTEIEAETGTVTETEYVETVDDEGNPVTEAVETELTVLYITVSHKPVEEIAFEYCFNEERRVQLEELLSDEYATLWNNVLYGTGSGCGDLVAVALSQVGNTGETYWTYMGYTDRVEWCACFVSWCANECGYIEDGTLPKTASCSTGVDWFVRRDRWQEPTYTNAQGETVPYIPSPGDFIYFDWDRPCEGQNGQPDHVGIVEKVENGYIYTVEGNSGDRVSHNAWSIGYYEIFGFGEIDYSDVIFCLPYRSSRSFKC